MAEYRYDGGECDHRGRGEVEVCADAEDFSVHNIEGQVAPPWVDYEADADG